MSRSNKCDVCGARGSKGYLSVPKESDQTTFKRQWQAVISVEVSPTTRVCFRHFARDELYLSLRGSVKIIEGMYLVYFLEGQDQVQRVQNVESGQSL